jgi:hypothetical protein
MRLLRTIGLARGGPAAGLLVSAFAVGCLAPSATVASGPGARAARAVYCGTFRARATRLYAYRVRGFAGCRETRRVLRAWFLDRRHTQRYRRWTCFDSLGPALERGEIQHCATRRGDVIADYSHRR